MLGAAPVAEKTLLHRSLANDNLERNRGAAPYQAQIHGATDAHEFDRFKGAPGGEEFKGVGHGPGDHPYLSEDDA